MNYRELYSMACVSIETLRFNNKKLQKYKNAYIDSINELKEMKEKEDYMPTAWGLTDAIDLLEQKKKELEK